MQKFSAELKNSHLVIDLDLDACGFTAVKSVAVYPTEQSLEEEMENGADVRFVIDVSGSMKPPE